MNATYIFDTYALLEIKNICDSDVSVLLFLDDLTERVKQGTVSYPDAVAKECRTFSAADPATVWVNACTGNRRHGAVPSNVLTAVLLKCPDIIDEEQLSDSSQAETLALACHLNGSQPPVFIVSEEPIDNPTRDTLPAVTQNMGIPVVSLTDFMNATGMAHLLAA